MKDNLKRRLNHSLGLRWVQQYNHVRETRCISKEYLWILNMNPIGISNSHVWSMGYPAVEVTKPILLHSVVFQIFQNAQNIDYLLNIAFRFNRHCHSLGCGHTCQMWMQFKESNKYFHKIENFPHGEINGQDLINLSPPSATYLRQWIGSALV